MLVLEDIKQFVLKKGPAVICLTRYGYGTGGAGAVGGSYFDELFELVVVEIICGPFRDRALANGLSKLHVQQVVCEAVSVGRIIVGRIAG